MSASPAILRSPREHWLADRRRIVTASDCAAIANQDERRGPFAVWAEKTSEIETAETVPMRRGRRMQAAIAEEYGEQTGRVVVPWPEFEIRRHPSIPWIGATLDAVTRLDDGAEIPLEIKLGLGSSAVVGKAMEGGVLRKEDEAKYMRILPIISDPPDVAKAKLENLKSVMAQDAEIYLETLEAAGRNVTKIRETLTKQLGSAPAQPAATGASKYKIVEVR